MTLPKFETLTFRRDIAAPPARVFAAVESVEARQQWSAPHPSIRVTFEQAEFRPGGREAMMCGPEGAQGMRVDLLCERIETDG